ncbi:amino acid permease [Candidatus Dependentiae bacterium]|nr:amino acid permease [Candidatus Dependentiae bacterium]
MHKNKTSNTNKIGLISAVIVGVNSMIGAGIAAIPTVLAAQAGPAGILSCIFSMMFVLCIGLSLGRCAEIYPGQGWNYLYPSKWGGHKLGLFSASCYLSGIILGLGFLAHQVGVWCHAFIPFLSPRPLGLIIMFILMFLVLAGTQTSAATQKLIVAFVIIPLLITSIFCWYNFDYNLMFPFFPYGIDSVFKAAPSVLFALLGFESIISLYGIIKNPRKNMPLAFGFSILTVGFTYILFFYGVLFAIPSKFFIGGLHETLSHVLARFFENSKILPQMVLTGAVFGIIGTLHAMIWSISALFTTLLKKTKSKLIHHAIEKKIWTFKTSVFVTTGLILLASLLIRLESLINLTSMLVAISYILSISSLLFVKKEWRSGHNIITLLGLVGGGLMIYFSLHKIIFTWC